MACGEAGGPWGVVGAVGGVGGVLGEPGGVGGVAGGVGGVAGGAGGVGGVVGGSCVDKVWMADQVQPFDQPSKVGYLLQHWEQVLPRSG